MSDILIIEAIRDDLVARRYLKSVVEDDELPETLLPPRKWVWALYLTDAGKLRVATKHLARLLDIPCEAAKEVGQRIARMRTAASVTLSALCLLLGEFFELVGVGLDTALVRLA
jgi:hypothetical protein